MKRLRLILALLGLILPVMATGGPRKLEHRAWLGGELKLAKPGAEMFSETRVGALPRDLKQRSGIFVSAVHPGTPLAAAGVLAGDLILAIDDKPMTSMKAIQRAVESRSPGDTIRISVYHDNSVNERKATLGIESYEHWRTLGFGLMLASKFDIVPDPGFSVLLLGFNRRNERIDLRSPEVEFIRRHHKSLDVNHGVTGRESWQAWCVLLSLGAHKQIVSQESFPSERTR